MALQHLRSSTADKRPTPAAMSDGQLALNTNLVSPGLFFKDSNGDSVKIGPVHVGTTAPNATPGAGGQAGNSKGEAWLDTTAANPILKVWNGSAFVAVQPVGTGTVVSTADTGTVTSTMILDGTILNADINASAAIVDTKLATIATGGKVSGTAITSGNISTSGSFTSTSTVTGTNLIPTGSGVPTNGVYLPAANSVGVATNGVQRINIEADGDINIDGGGMFYDATNNRLAIGTTSPGQALEVLGTIYSQNNATSIVHFQAADTGAATDEKTWRIAQSQRAAKSIQLGVALNDASSVANAAITIVRSGATLDNIQFATGSGSERARIDSSGRLLIGTSTSRTTTNTPQILVESVETASGNRGITIVNGGTTSASPLINFAKHKSASIGGTTAVSDGDFTGAIVFNGSDGTNFILSAAISAAVDGTPSANDMPGRLVFSTTADGAASPTERMRITSTGQVRLAGAGITFNGDTAAANELDDYEEGTWTPVYTGLTGSIGATAYTQQAGTYTKIGRQVTATMRVTLSSKGSWTGTVVFTGLPFTAANNSQQNMGSIWTDLVTFVNQINARVGPNEATIVPRILTSATNGAYLQTSGVADTSVFYATVTYFI